MAKITPEPPVCSLIRTLIVKSGPALHNFPGLHDGAISSALTKVWEQGAGMPTPNARAQSLFIYERKT